MAEYNMVRNYKKFSEDYKKWMGRTKKLENKGFKSFVVNQKAMALMITWKCWRKGVTQIILSFGNHVLDMEDWRTASEEKEIRWCTFIQEENDYPGGE